MASIIIGGIQVKAIIKTGGKQYTVSEKDVITIEKVATEEGKKHEFTEVLAIIDGDKLTVGKPLVSGAKVTAKVLAHGKERKIIVFKYKPKKSYSKKMGHRQQFTKVQIDKISLKAEKSE
jgi:large subunit ribosomal protein L21